MSITVSRSFSWDYQKNALKGMMDYMNIYKNKSSNKSTLVQMPTGNGKSGVIAVLSRFLEFLSRCKYRHIFNFKIQ